MSRAGKKAFESCDVKIVEFQRRIRVFVNEELSSENSIVLNEEDVSDDQRKNSRINGYSAVLHCPRTDDDQRSSVESARRSHTSQVSALRSVKELAGELLCRDCIFSSMSPVEVAQHRTALAKAETERVEAFKELAEARQSAIAEIEGTDANFHLS